MWRDLPDYVSVRTATLPFSPPQPTHPPSQIVEATGFLVNAQGQVELVASFPNRTGVSATFAQPQCSELSN